MIVEPRYILRREDAKRCPILGSRNMKILILGSDLATSTCQGVTHGMDRETERATLYVEPVVINDRNAIPSLLVSIRIVHAACDAYLK